MQNQFDAKAAQWDEEPRRIQMARAIADAIAAAVPLDNTMTALEFGCGTGLVTAFLAPRLASITAVDTSAGMLNVLNQKIKTLPLPNASAMNADLTQNNPIRNTFDLIYSSMTFHHIRDYKAMLTLFGTMLNPQGRLAIADLDAEDGSFHGPDAHIEHKGFDRAEFIAALQSLGLTDFTASTPFSIPRQQPDNTLRHYPVFLITAKKP